VAETERDARRALMRLQRAVEKVLRELSAVDAALRVAGDGAYPAAEFDEAARHLDAVAAFVDGQAERMQAMTLEAGGLDPDRLRRGRRMLEDET